MLVKPVYGYGWYTAAMQAREVPPEFAVELEVIERGFPFRTAMGLVTERNHLLTDLWIVLLQRTAGSEPSYNLDAYNETPLLDSVQKPVLTGFAMVFPISN